jgi:tRNA A-37 threonylcarbamoyl transferase component Bud32
MDTYMKINELIKTYDRIFIEASTLLSHGGQFLLNEISKYDVISFNGANHVIITNETLFLLSEASALTKVNYLLSTLQKLNQDKIVQFKNFEGEPFDIIFNKFIERYSLALITNDKTIAEKVISSNYSSNSKKLGVYSLNSQISLDSYIKVEKEPVKEVLIKSTTIDTVPFPKVEQRDSFDVETFNLNNEIDTSVESNPFSKQFLLNPIKFKGIENHDTVLNYVLPNVHDTLTTSKNKTITLTSLLTDKGGEGTIYYTSLNGYVCKVYKKDALTKHKLEKLQLLVSKPLNDARIAYPSELVYFKGNFVGYIMPFVKGSFIGDFFYGKLSLNKFKNWTRLNLIELCISILSLVSKTHAHGMLIGDVNRNNFMVESSKNVYMVDVDSSQIEKYPCPVGVEEFTPPEIIDGEHSYKEFFRTYENEYYSLAVLIFMILTLGAQTTTKISFKKADGSYASLNKVQKIKLQEFGFTLDEAECRQMQNSINFAIWSRFPSYIKEAFYHTFHKKGKYNQPKTRLSPEKWIELLKSYQFHLNTLSKTKDFNDFNSLISENSISFNSMKLEPAKYISFKTFANNIPDISKSISSILKTNKITKINFNLDTLYNEGEINQDEIKIKITKNLGFMYQINGLILFL